MSTPTRITRQKVHAVLRKAGFERSQVLSGNGWTRGYELGRDNGGEITSVSHLVGYRVGGKKWGDHSKTADFLARYCAALVAAGLPARVEGDRVVFEGGEQ